MEFPHDLSLIMIFIVDNYVMSRVRLPVLLQEISPVFEQAPTSPLANPPDSIPTTENQYCDTS